MFQVSFDRRKHVQEQAAEAAQIAAERKRMQQEQKAAKELLFTLLLHAYITNAWSDST